MTQPNSSQESHTDDVDIPEDSIGKKAKETLLDNPQRIVRDTLCAIIAIVFSGSVVSNKPILYNMFDYDPFATAIIYLSYTLGTLSILLLGLIIFNTLLSAMIIAVDRYFGGLWE